LIWPLKGLLNPVAFYFLKWQRDFFILNQATRNPGHFYSLPVFSNLIYLFCIQIPGSAVFYSNCFQIGDKLKNSGITILLLVLATLTRENPFLPNSKKNQLANQDNQGRQASPEKRAGKGYTYLALGDSYTIGESLSLQENYPSQTAALLNKQELPFQNPLIIAKTGWTTANLLKAIENTPDIRTPYEVVTLLIGVNNQYQGGSLGDYRVGFENLLEKSIYFAGGRASHVIVLSIPDYSVTPFASARPDFDLIAGQIDSFNLVNREIAGKYRVNYLDITKESRKACSDPDLLAFDGLHYSAKEYGIWASRLAELIRGIVR